MAREDIAPVTRTAMHWALVAPRTSPAWGRSRPTAANSATPATRTMASEDRRLGSSVVAWACGSRWPMEAMDSQVQIRKQSIAPSQPNRIAACHDVSTAHPQPTASPKVQDTAVRSPAVLVNHRSHCCFGNRVVPARRGVVPTPLPSESA